MEALPTEIWQNIFSLACIDDGSTGRSLSLVSAYVRDVSGPFKYQSLVLADRSQIIAFAEIFCQLPDSQRKIKYLFVHHPEPLPGSEGWIPGQSTVSYVEELDNVGSDDEVEDWEEDDSDYVEEWDDGRSDNESEVGGFSGSDTRPDDTEFQAPTNITLQAFRAILNATSSTLTHLALDWTSFKPFQMQELLPPLPHLTELHINRHSTFGRDHYFYEDPPPTILFPQLRVLHISGDHPRKLSFSHDLARIAPNVTELQFSIYCIDDNWIRYDPQTPKHVFNFNRITVQDFHSVTFDDMKTLITKEFGNLGELTKLGIGHKCEDEEIWQRWS